MGILEKTRRALVAALTPEPKGEAAYIAQVYGQQSKGTSIEPKNWYRLVNEVGDCVGFMFCCACKTSYRFFSHLEATRPYECPHCKTKFELLKFVGLTSKSPIAELTPALAALPMRPQLTGKSQTPRFVDPGDVASGDVEWAGQNPSVPSGWK